MHNISMPKQSTSSLEQQVQCHECAIPVAIPELNHRQKALCPRCGFQLTSYHRNATDRILAFSITALIFLAASLPFDFLSFRAQGREQSIDIPLSISILAGQDYLALAIIELLAIVALPGAILIGLLYLLLPLKFGFQPAGSKSVLKLVFALIPWSMAEIFLVGVLVNLIKIISLADIGLGMSFYAYIFFTIALIAALLHADRHQLELLIETTKSDQMQSVHKPVKTNPHSVQHTWALLLTSLVLYIPANTLPIMNTRLLGRDDPNTILGGIFELWKSGSYPIALIIFIASIFVPIVKLVILCWLNYSVQKGLTESQTERIFWYRITEFIGRWSMVDVFVVAILVSLIQLGNTLSIYPGPAALAFCGVVICTMLAAITFDSHL